MPPLTVVSHSLWGAVTGAPVRACSIFSRTLCAISLAALRVKVIAKTCSGRSTLASKASNLWVSNSVFPEPAGAETQNCVLDQSPDRGPADL